MKRIYLVVAAVLLLHLATHAQNASQSSGTAADTSHVMLQPNANTAYFDEDNRKIDAAQFTTKLQTGQFSFEPNVVNGILKSMRLKKSEKVVKPGGTAPAFFATDLNGKEYTLSELKDKVVVLNFWFTSCAPCRVEIPELNKLVEKYKKDENVVFIAITRDPAARVKDFLAKTKFDFNVIADQAALIKQYGISFFPTNIVVKDGRVAFILASYSPNSVDQLNGVIGALRGSK
jgi:peroxiredoxin